MKNKSEKSALLEKAEEIAFEAGYDLASYLEMLSQRVNEEKQNKFRDYPEEVKTAMQNAESISRAERERKKSDAQKEKVKAQIVSFLEVFPDISPEDIPNEVWIEAADGEDLAHAYALWTYKSHDNAMTEEDIKNSENQSRSVPVKSERTEPLSFTKEDVEKMTPEKIKGNYSKILASMKRWHF